MYWIEELAKDHTSTLFCASYEMSGWEKSVGKAMAQKGFAVAQKAFNISSNYRRQMAFAPSGVLRSGGQRFAAAVRVI